MDCDRGSRVASGRFPRRPSRRVGGERPVRQPGQRANCFCQRRNCGSLASPHFASFSPPEHVCSIIASMLRNLKSQQRSRLLNKFTENDCEKVCGCLVCLSSSCCFSRCQLAAAESSWADSFSLFACADAVASGKTERSHIMQNVFTPLWISNNYISPVCH